MGTLGGIGELAREVFGGEAEGRRPAPKPSQRRPRRTSRRAGRTEDRRLMLDDLEPGWLWMIGGVLLLIAEIIAPGFFLVFIGAAAIATGLFTLLFDLGVAAQLDPVRALRGRRGDDRQALLRQADTRRSDPLLNDRGRAARRQERDGHRSRRRACAAGSASATANGARAAAPVAPASAFA